MTGVQTCALPILPALTTHQRRMLDYLLAFFEANDQLPPNAQIARPVLAAARQPSAEAQA